MTATRASNDERRRPAPSTSTGAPSFLQLTETPTGWTLTIALDEHLLAAFRTGGTVTTEHLTALVSPNLVPGEPFAITSVNVIGQP